MPTPQLNVATAFAAGFVSFISPCVLPLVPAYMSFLTGSTVEELKGDQTAAAKGRVIGHSIAFILGFTIVFVLLGVFASAAGGILAANKLWIARIGGVIIIILGLNMMGVFKIPFLMMDKRPQFRSVNRSYIASLIVGIAFAAGWSPCIGPILSAILFAASQQHTLEATGYMLAYSAGLAVPFFLVAAAFNRSLAALNRIKRYLPVIEFVAGLILIGVGIILLTDSFVSMTGWLNEHIPQP
ncbi:MAG: cytochrome c biogenesis protein CcdA, partial [Candidatus Eremiobacteraeota bacterium]|nr:cytochrome c biogenesis protein CcdA [Candidatus Eremiobacteraeota bacterium]